MKSFRLLSGVLLLMTCALARAADDAAPTSQPSVVAIGDKDALAASEGKMIAVEGTVSEAAWSPTGKVFSIKFKEADDSHFQAAVFSKNRTDMEKAFDGDLTKAFEGAKVRVAGKLQMFKEHPEIVVGDAKQITVLAKGESTAATQPAEAK